MTSKNHVLIIKNINIINKHVDEDSKLKSYFSEREYVGAIILI
ncbi:protein of unknown function [Clostridium beijerinckii]|nr:protein of unknown function [Clostridium beijerinckii]